MTTAAPSAPPAPVRLSRAEVAARTLEATLRDGTHLVIRPILPRDRTRLARGYEALSAESRLSRFVSPPQHLTEHMLDYFTVVDHVDHEAIVALDRDRPREPGVGVARYVRLRDDPAVAEAAVTVLDAYQARGVGSLLMHVLAASARVHGVHRFCGFVLRDNLAMLDLAERLGAAVTPDEPGVVRIDIDLDESAQEIAGTRLHAILRAVARGEVGMLVHGIHNAHIRWTGALPAGVGGGGTPTPRRRVGTAGGGAGRTSSRAGDEVPGHAGAADRPVSGQSVTFDRCAPVAPLLQSRRDRRQKARRTRRCPQP